VIVLDALFILAAAALFAVAGRYAFFAGLALLGPRPRLPERAPATKFCVLVPAHNEESGVAATVTAALSLDYPIELFRVLVLADNCTDGTAKIAREAGAEVVERHDPENAGKGQAVAWAIANHFAADESLAICDADSTPAPDYLCWMDRALTVGFGAAQGFNGAANADESGLAALAALTSTMKNALHYAGKTAAGLPAPLMNGLTISAATLAEHPWDAFSLTEDFEMYLHLVAAGYRVRFVPEAKMLSPRARAFAAAASQKARWSGGQSSLAREVAWPLAKRAMRDRSVYKFSAALDVLLPGYAPVTGLLAAVALAGALVFCGEAHPAVGLALAGLTLMVAQFVVGLSKMRWTPKLALAIALAPFYIGWKIALIVKSAVRRPDRWQRADRD
jgi:1,2-diacylglycerol 3-beta-glucosyltransferase